MPVEQVIQLSEELWFSGLAGFSPRFLPHPDPIAP